MRVLLIALFLSINVFAQSTKEHVYIHGYTPERIAFYSQHPSLTVDHATGYGFELYGPEGMKKWLNDIGEQYSEVATLRSFGASLSQYPSYEEITEALQTLAANNPHIFSLFSIGQSVEGRELWVMKVSDNVLVDELEPEFKYISSMHGDEITGRELMIYTLQDIALSYGVDRAITHLVNNTEIFIMPSMNPDGSEKKQRGNANYKDLNRNFPDIWGQTAYFANREVETMAVMNFQAARQFSLSANFHGGAVVVNYPWDSAYERHPFNNLVAELSLGYSKRNYEMYNSPDFHNGITNGADWYLVTGGMQDWSYVFFNDLQVTVELSNMKWPNYSDIPDFYERNKESIFYYMKAVHQGAGFILSYPGLEGTVEIFNSSNQSLGQYIFRESEFYKVLEAGTYRFEIHFEGIYRTINVDVTANYIYNDGNYQVVE